MDLTPLTTLLTVAFLIVTMSGIGIRLGPHSVIAVASIGPVLRLGLVSLALVPLAGIVIAGLLPLSEPARFAIVALAVAPAGTVGPKLVQLARGDLGLGVAAAFGLSAIATLTVAPTLLLATTVLGLDVAAAAIDGAPIIARLVAFQLLPLLAGMILVTRRPALASRVLGPATRLSHVLLAAVVAVALISGWSDVLALGALPFVAGMLLLAVADALGWLAGGPTAAGRRTGLLITGQRSGALALLLAIGLDWPAAQAAVVALAVLNLVGNTTIALVTSRPTDLRVPTIAPSR